LESGKEISIRNKCQRNRKNVRVRLRACVCMRAVRAREGEDVPGTRHASNVSEATRFRCIIKTTLHNSPRPLA